jgi:hypothetical protein
LSKGFIWRDFLPETVFEVVNQENDKLDQKRKSKLANINGHGKLLIIYIPIQDLLIPM